jgi:hypothetical protein
LENQHGVGPDGNFIARDVMPLKQSQAKLKLPQQFALPSFAQCYTGAISGIGETLNVIAKPVQPDFNFLAPQECLAGFAPRRRSAIAEKFFTLLSGHKKSFLV